MNINDTTKPAEINTKLSKLPKDEITKRDLFGRSILHLVILTNKVELLKRLLMNHYVKNILNFCDYENGWNCMHYIIFYKRVTCYQVLLEHFRSSSAKQNSILLNNATLLELLKTKDRAGVTPLQLLDNDFKDLIWIPEYINEKNEYHISYRFQSNETPTKSSSDSESQEVKRPSIKSPQVPWNSIRGGSEIYMLGSNTSNHLGFEDSNDRSIPSKLSHIPFKEKQHSSIQDEFKKPRFKKILISKYHSLILTADGSIYSCGKGSRGRLGHSNLLDCFKFEKVLLESSVKLISIHNNHSVAVTFNNQVYTWGLNNFDQLGYESQKRIPTKGFVEFFESTPTAIGGDLRKNSKKIIGVATSKIHSVVYTESELYFWGLNIGQMGISSTFQPIEFRLNDKLYKGEIQSSPKSVSMRDNIKLVETCELCTFIVTDKNDIHVYYQFHHYKLPKIPVKGSSDKDFDLFKPTRLTKAISITKIVAKNSENCTILLDNGNVMTFSFNPDDYKSTKYSFVWKAYDQDMVVTDIDGSYDGSIILCTRNGSVFVKTSHSGQRKKSMSETSLPIAITKNKFKKIENVNKVVRVSCDASFSSFGFIRDDIDLLPLKLQKNDFINDLSYLSCINDTDLYRKQDQTLTLDHNYKTYLSSFFYPDNHQLGSDEITEEVADDESNENQVTDLLLTKYNHKYNYHNRRPKTNTTYDLQSEREYSFLNRESFQQKYFRGNEQIDRDFDCTITFKKHPELAIRAHKDVLMKRSAALKRVLDETNSDDLFVSDNFEAKLDPENSVFEIDSSFQVISVVIFIHFIYCSETMELTDDVLCSLDLHSTLSEQDMIKFKRKVTLELDKLKNMFDVFDIKTRAGGLSQLTNMYNDLATENFGDVIVKLRDGEIRCHSFMLKTRSAYFETLLSDRWDNDGSEFLDFTDVRLSTFKAILRHIYGGSIEKVLDFGYSFDDSEEYINELLELIEVSDELLLFQLKALCQVPLCDMINLDNVLILLAHADNLSAEKLFMNCCWYIYNNLEILLFDSSFTELSIELMKALEAQIIYFQNCKSIDFLDDCGTLNQKMLVNWFQNDADNLIDKFLNNTSDYNEIFISDRKGYLGFAPLIDAKYEQVKEVKKKRDRKNSRKSSTIHNDILDFRNSIVVRENENYVHSPVVEENSFEEFEVVQKGGRRKSKSYSALPASSNNSSRQLSASSSTSSLVSSNPSSSWASTPGTFRGSSPPCENPSSGSQFPSLQSARKQETSTSVPASNITPLFNWASKTSGNSILKETKRVSPPRASIEREALEFGKKNGAVNSKAKIGPIIKLSQKERKKKLALEQSEDNIGPTDVSVAVNVNPWAPASTTNSVEVQEDLSSLPVLGSSSSQRKSSLKTKLEEPTTARKVSFNSAHITSSSPEEAAKVPTPSLTEIMIEESLKIERAKLEEQERKTLAEIQQEQEFARWWAEETARVQKSMGLSQAQSPTSKQNAGDQKPSTNRRKKSNTKDFKKPRDSHDTNSATAPNVNGNSTSKSKNVKRNAKDKANRQIPSSLET